MGLRGQGRREASTGSTPPPLQWRYSCSTQYFIWRKTKAGWFTTPGALGISVCCDNTPVTSTSRKEVCTLVHSLKTRSITDSKTARGRDSWTHYVSSQEAKEDHRWCSACLSLFTPSEVPARGTVLLTVSLGLPAQQTQSRTFLLDTP